MGNLDAAVVWICFGFLKLLRPSPSPWAEPTKLRGGTSGGFSLDHDRSPTLPRPTAAKPLQLAGQSNLGALDSRS
jgi:hypothetical protein